MSREMRHSGIEWIGEIPKEWNICRLKRICFQNPNTLSDKTDRDFEFEYVDIGSVSFEKGIFRSELLKYKDAPSRARRKACIGDVILSTVRTYLRAIDIVNTPKKADYIYSTGFAVLTPYDNVNYKFLSYLVKSDSFLEQVSYLSKGINYPSINSTDLMSINVAFPSLISQQKIANYLDKVCGEVDEMIALQEQMIEELKAYKQSVITEAVTKGLNPNAPMRDSGIDWIGEIPENWKVIRIKYLLKERKERSDTGLEEPLSMSQKYGLIPTKEMDAIPNIASSFVGAKLVYLHDLVFNKLKAHLGVFAESDYDGLVSPDYAVYYSSGLVDVKYLEYLFKSPQYIAEFIKLSTGVGAGLTRLYTSDLYSIYGIVPPIEIQREIVDYIRQLSSEINTLIAIKQAKIEELKEYKKSVIYEYVTGKKEVV